MRILTLCWVLLKLEAPDPSSLDLYCFVNFVLYVVIILNNDYSKWLFWQL